MTPLPRSLFGFSASCLLVALLSAWCAAPAGADDNPASDTAFHLRMRVRLPVDEHGARWRVDEQVVAWPAAKTAVIVCDMWDQHWCQGATKRVGEMAPRMNETLVEARRRGALVIHCPSSCLAFYADTPMRRRAAEAPAVEPKTPLANWRRLDPAREGRLPVDDSDGGCDCHPQCPQGSPWRRQIDVIQVAEQDAVTDNVEAYYLLRARGIEHVIVMGVHANMCVLGRPFAIRQLVEQGLDVALCRDLTDSMYNSRREPFVPHVRGTELIVEHIEKHWCPSFVSTDITGRAAVRFAEDARPHAVLVIGEDEYQAERTLPAFAQEELAPRGYAITEVHVDPLDKHAFRGLEALDTADVVLLYARRRALPAEQLAALRKYVGAGRPLVALRTSSHAFALREGATPAGRDVWPEFDRDVLGGNYQGHYGSVTGAASAQVWVERSAAAHPIVAGLASERWGTASSLYKTKPLAEATTVLLAGRSDADPAVHPVAWTRAHNGGRVFYTSLGHVDDFANPQFRQLVVQAVAWSLAKRAGE